MDQEQREPTPADLGAILKLLGGWKLPKERLRALEPQLAGTFRQVQQVRKAPVHHVEPLTIFAPKR
ncbi:MAG TPA: hypothetical protein VIL95_06165 [Bacillota bacterium]